MIRHCQPMSLLFLSARHGRVNVAKARSVEDLADPATAKGPKRIKRAALQKAWIAQRARECAQAVCAGSPVEPVQLEVDEQIILGNTKLALTDVQGQDQDPLHKFYVSKVHDDAMENESVSSAKSTESWTWNFPSDEEEGGSG